MSLDLSLSHCSEIGFCRVETCGLLARQLVQSRDISRLRELAFVNWVTALIKTCLFVFFSGCSEMSGHLEGGGGECRPRMGGSSCTSFFVRPAAKANPGPPTCGGYLGLEWWYNISSGEGLQL